MRNLNSAFDEANNGETQSYASYANGFKASLRRKVQIFRKEEDGSLIIFGLYMFITMLAVAGLAIDAMRAEEHRTRIQYTTDRALLAAAPMNQRLPAQVIFDDIFAKAGLAGLAPTATVINGDNFRKVSADYAPADVPSVNTIFMSKSFRSLLNNSANAEAAGLDKLDTIASGIAVDGVEKVEISLVLDVSGSMSWSSYSGHSKLYDLKEAAKEFVDTLMLDQPDDDTYSISIVPFATQVNAGANLLSKYIVSNEHDYSNCVDFDADDFSTTQISTVTGLQRTGHFAKWNTNYRVKPVADWLRVCSPDARREILPLSGDIATLKNYVDDLRAGGNTSADIGLKWGAAMLDPAAQTVVSSLISDGDVEAKFLGRPFDFSQEGILKVIVLMSDGANTNQYYLTPEVSGSSIVPEDNMSNVWHRLDSHGRDRYAIYNGGHSGSRKYLRTYRESTSGYWRSTPGSGMERMSYVELYDHATVRYIAKYLMSPAGYSYNHWRYGIYNTIGGRTKDTRMDDICEAAKNNDVLIFTIGFEVTDSNATKLSDCATTAGHFFRVEGVEISEAFSSIAAQLHRLRLER